MLSQCLLSAVDRDALSGWGAVVHIMYVQYITCMYRLLFIKCNEVWCCIVERSDVLYCVMLDNDN